MGIEVVVAKPSRSDEVLDADLQLKIAQETKAHFDSLAPKRPKKPARSEASSSFPDDHHPPAYDDFKTTTIPELTKFQSLQSQSNTMILEGGVAVHEDEFVETEYYKKLNSIDKLHHTTGSGFIRVDAPGGGGGVVSFLGQSDGTAAMAAPVRSNPATNDWIPTVDEVVFVSSKPARSESSL